MAEFTPKTCAGLREETEKPEVPLPNVGDTMRLLVDDYGFWVVADKNQTPRPDQKIFEVEVKKQQKVVVSIEDEK